MEKITYKDSISTHTPLARRDDEMERRKEKGYDISTHTPLARRDEHPIIDVTAQGDFYSHASCEA